MSTSEKELAALLGVGRRATERLGMADAVARGLPEKSLERVKESLGLTDEEMAAALGLSGKTIGRLRAERAPLSTVTSDRLYRMARLYALASDVLEEPAAARDWLKEPQLGLGRRVPLELMTTEAGAREVEDLLGRIEYGVLS